MGSSDERSPSGRNLATDATIAGDSSPSVTDETMVGDSSPNASVRSGDSNTDGELPRGFAVGEYEIEEVIGRGGFGTVYRATQPVIGKRVAIKVLSRKYSADDEMVSRFKAEAKAVNQIRHRHIIDIFSFGGLPDGRQYYVMELLDGEPLDQYLATNGPLRLDQALPILRAIARALDAAHAKGVAHRDLKPENVFLGRDDDGSPFPKLLDFGIAKLNNPDEALAHKTNTGVPLGTPYYMSPEQCRGQNVDHRTDIYSFGVLAYRLLTGRFPFEGGLIDILHRHMHDEPPAPSTRKADLGPAIDAAILWMLSKEPADRPKSAIAAVVALQDEQAPTPMLSAGAIGVTEKVPRRAKRGWLVPALALVVIAGSVAVFFAMRGTDTKIADVRPTIAPPPTPDAAVVTVTPDAAAPVSTDIIIEVTGVPEGTEVSLGKTIVGSAPGPVQITRSEKRMALTFRAEGYLSVSRPIVPDRDQPLDVGGLKKKPQGLTRPAKPNNPEDPDEIPSPFQKEKQR